MITALNNFKILIEVANEINKMCPIMVDHLTRLDNAIALPNNVFQEFIEPTVVNTVSTNSDM